MISRAAESMTHREQLALVIENLDGWGWSYEAILRLESMEADLGDHPASAPIRTALANLKTGEMAEGICIDLNKALRLMDGAAA